MKKVEVIDPAELERCDVREEDLTEEDHIVVPGSKYARCGAPFFESKFCGPTEALLRILSKGLDRCPVCGRKLCEKCFSLVRNSLKRFLQ